MRKNGVIRIYAQKNDSFMALRNIFAEPDKGKAMNKLSGYRMACINKRNPLGLKRATIIKQLMETL